MGNSEKIRFNGGRNIAMKVPSQLWQKTVGFYRDVVGLKVVDQISTEPLSVCFEFGANRLWIDCMEILHQTEVWLELTTDDVRGAATHLNSAGIVRRDDVEPLPDGFEGFWIQNPASVIHLVASPHT